MTAKKAQLAAPLENVISISVALPNLAEPIKSKKSPALALFGTLFYGPSTCPETRSCHFKLS